MVLLTNSCSNSDPHKPKEIHLMMCELSCTEYKKDLGNYCKFKEGKCYFQQGCSASGYKKHKTIEDAIFISTFDCFLYKR